jgi:PqqD family protein of HPr-rel-A system
MRFRRATDDMLYRWWNEECVVYDASTGRTHQLDAVAGQVLMALPESVGLTIESLFDVVFTAESADGKIPMRGDERDALRSLLEQLQALELVELTPA